MTFLDVQGISKHYGPVCALDGIALSVAAGSRTAIVGPSGSGKTTLMRLIAGFEAPDAGRITLDGQVLAEGPSALPAHRRGIGVVAQDGALFPHLSVAGNIGFGLDRGMPQRAERIRALMDMVELARTMHDRRPHELSGGQQQRVALARALARQPKLILFDDPFSALDAGLRESMRKAVADLLRSAGITSILVTHDQAEALSFADQVAVLREGRLAQVGSPRALYASPDDRATAAFLGDAIVLPADLGDGWARCVLGRVAIDAGGRRGPGEIMLRPEQLQLTPIAADMAADNTDPTACLGQVTHVEFGGAICAVTVTLGEGLDPLAPRQLSIRSSGANLPPVGARVHITVSGSAHVFAAPPDAR